MERYWLAVLVVAFLALSSTNGAAFIGPGEELQCMLGAVYIFYCFSRFVSRSSPSFRPSTRRYVTRNGCYKRLILTLLYTDIAVAVKMWGQLSGVCRCCCWDVLCSYTCYYCPSDCRKLTIARTHALSHSYRCTNCVYTSLSSFFAEQIIRGLTKAST